MDKTKTFTISEPGIITGEYVKTVIRKREADIHKGDCGRVLIIAGSKGMAGAALLCGTGALRAGSGLVRVSIDEELFPIVQVGLREATCVPRAYSLGDLSQFDAVAIGPGLGDDAENVKIIEHVLKNYKCTVVIDADGLNTISKYELKEAVRNAAGSVVITPHAGEAQRLLGISKEEYNERGREVVAGALASEYNCIAVLKGSGTIVTTPELDSYINTTGNPGMATGGSGDVLTGIIASFAGQGLSALDAVKAGVYIHGLAGDIGASSLSQHGLIAGDIAAFTALAIKEITGQ